MLALCFKDVKLRFGDLYVHLRYGTGGSKVLLEPLFFLIRSLLIITIVFVIQTLDYKNIAGFRVF